MKRFTSLTTAALAPILLLVMLAFPPAAFAANRGISVTTKAGKPVKLYRDYAALVIGISDYRYWPKLPGAIRDAKEVAAALQSKGFKVKLVQNPDSDTLKDILNRLPYNQGKPKDRALLIYFAGHGATESLADGAKMGYIVPKDCPLPNVDPAGFAGLGISMQSFESLARRIRCRHVLMAFDSCFSGSLFALGRAAPRDISEKVSRPVRQFLTAGNENEEVPDQSTFKQVFVDGIGGEADYDRDGYVTGSELGMYLQKEVVNYTRGAQHPQYGKIRNPKLDKGDFVFLLAGGPGTIPEVKPTPPPPAPPKAPGTDELAALKEKARQKAAWSTWQKRMDAYWKEVEELESSQLSAKEKARAWRGALGKFGDDNPFTTEDESLRSYAETRVKHWENESTAAARAAREAKAKARAEAARKERERREAEARRKREAAGGGKRITNSIGMAFVRIPAGSFTMGSNNGDSYEKPVHRVTISRSFYMQTTEVTQAQWKSVMGNNPSRFKGDNLPVERVSWNDAQEFIKRLNRKEGASKYRLPTEAEWEYAARAGGTGAYCFGNDRGRLGEYAWYSSNSGNETHHVGTKKPNGWGLYDMHGNVWEWVQDWFGKGYYSSSPNTDPRGPSSGTTRVNRGGSWDLGARCCRSAFRNGYGPGLTNDDLGFRVARVAP